VRKSREATLLHWLFVCRSRWLCHKSNHSTHFSPSFLFSVYLDETKTIDKNSTVLVKRHPPSLPPSLDSLPGRNQNHRQEQHRAREATLTPPPSLPPSLVYLDETKTIDKNSTVLVKRVAAPRGSVGLLARLKANTPLTPQNMYVRREGG